MEFKTFLVKTGSSSAINAALIGLILSFVSIFFWVFDALQGVALVMTISGILLVTIGLLLNKGKGLNEIDSQMLRIVDAGIEIRAQLYPFSTIKELSFFYHSFYSQSPYGYYFENAGLIENGTSNTIHFIAGNKEINEFFCLTDMEHANSLFRTLNLLKERGIIFKIDYKPFKGPFRQTNL